MISLLSVVQSKNNSLDATVFRGGSRTAATSKMEHFVIIVNGWKRSILDVTAFLDPPLVLTV